MVMRRHGIYRQAPRSIPSPRRARSGINTIHGLACIAPRHLIDPLLAVTFACPALCHRLGYGGQDIVRFTTADFKTWSAGKLVYTFDPALYGVLTMGVKSIDRRSDTGEYMMMMAQVSG